MGTDPLCTRTDARERTRRRARFHQTSLDQVIGKGKPVIAMFATPARCQSRYCGPVLDQLIGLAPEYQDRITPIHVEIYKDLTSNNLVTATETWLGFTGEPWIFAMDGDRQGDGPAQRRVRDRRDPHPHRQRDRRLDLTLVLGTLMPLGGASACREGRV